MPAPRAPRSSKLASLKIPDMPNGDADALLWMMNFSKTVNSEREALGLGDEAGAEICDAIAVRVKAFDDAYGIACDFTTRTSIAITAKTRARNDAVLAIRPALKIINDNPAISEVLRAGLGLKRRLDRRMRPINPRSRAAQRQAEAMRTQPLARIEPKPLLIEASHTPAPPTCTSEHAEGTPESRQHTPPTPERLPTIAERTTAPPQSAPVRP